MLITISISTEELSSRSSRTLCVENLPGDIRERQVEDLFYKYGPIVKIDLRTPPRSRGGHGYAFVEFEDPRDAEDAIRGRDGYKFAWHDGLGLEVYLAQCGRPSSSSYRGGRSRGGGVIYRQSYYYRVLITGLPSSTSRQDLIDHMRRAGDICFAQVFQERDGMMRGIVDYKNYDDMKYAIRKLDNSCFRSAYIRVEEEYDRTPSYSRGRSPSRICYSRSRCPSSSSSDSMRSSSSGRYYSDSSSSGGYSDSSTSFASTTSSDSSSSSESESSTSSDSSRSSRSSRSYICSSRRRG